MKKIKKISQIFTAAGKILSSKATGTENTYSCDYINNILDDSKAGFHNSLFRGKDITKYYEDGSLYTRISSGTFEDLFVGDYIVKNNITWRIAGFDVYLNRGVHRLTQHHVIIVPDEQITTASMNDTDTAVGGYVGSKMYQETLPNVLSTYITPVFGNHVLEHSTTLTTGINTTGYNRLGTNSGCANSWNWYSSKLNLMNEAQLLGMISWSSSGFEVASDNCQLPLFRLAPEFVMSGGSWYWLRNIANASEFVLMFVDGLSGHITASTTGGVRPYFYID